MSRLPVADTLGIGTNLDLLFGFEGPTHLILRGATTLEEPNTGQ
jgi:hypothetical protein